jgi:hypothetical protein
MIIEMKAIPGFSQVCSIFIISLLVFLIPSCGDKASVQSEDRQVFTEYVMAFSDGVISRKDDILVRFNRDVADYDVDRDWNSLFKFTPEIKGDVIWKNANTVVFRPRKALPYNTEFRGLVDLGSLFSTSRDLSQFPLNIKTRKQAMQVSYQGMEAYDPKDMVYQKLQWDVEFADYIESAEVENMLCVS